MSKVLPPALEFLFTPAGRAAGAGTGAKVSHAARSAAEIHLLRLKAAAARSAEGDQTAALELCATLENRQEREPFRLAAALFLAGAKGIPEAARCLGWAATSREEKPPLRAAAMLSLANIGGATAARSLEGILLSREAEHVAVDMRDLGKNVSLQKLAAMLLFDFEALHGRSILDRIARNPQEYLAPWVESIVVVFHADPGGYLQAMLDVLWDHRFSEAVRLTVLEAYAFLLSDRDMPIEGRDGWWDSLAAIHLSKKTESRRIREAAGDYLKKLRPPH
jgi:hypothetical protein